MRRARAIDWRGTAVLVSVDGPSIRTCLQLVYMSQVSQVFCAGRTRLWSMISTIVASFPSWDPPSMRTILPTSTNLQLEALISASPIVLAVEVEKLGAVCWVRMS